MRPDDRYDSLILFYSLKYARNPKQVKRQIRMESAFNPDAVSHVGAKGLMQFMSRTWDEWWDGTAGIEKPPIDLLRCNPFDPEDSIRSGCAYMLFLEKYFKDLSQALASYNWGVGNLKKSMQREGKFVLDALPKETQKYVIKGMEYQSEVITCVLPTV